eukprot:scaffold250657_cov17-Tisochrysis_lutea.AAC.1
MPAQKTAACMKEGSPSSMKSRGCSYGMKGACKGGSAKQHRMPIEPSASAMSDCRDNKKGKKGPPLAGSVPDPWQALPISCYPANPMCQQNKTALLDCDATTLAAQQDNHDMQHGNCGTRASTNPLR